MDPVSSADRLVMLLRQKLQERAKAGRAGGKARPDAGGPASATGIQAAAAVEGVDERQLRRALIQNLLAEQLGPELINDAQFQQIVSRVTGALEEDAGTAQLLSRIIAELRAP